MAEICRGGTRQISRSFNESELYSKSLDAPRCHEVADTTIKGLQAIRDHYGVPMTITSTLRTPTGNSIAGGVSDSRHLSGRAIDFVFSNPNSRNTYLKKFYDDFKCKGPLYRKLRGLGINGIGIYSNFIHIDNRETLSFWDDSAGAWGKTRITNAYMSQIPESGLNSSECEVESQQVAEETNSDYGLTGILAPLDSSNYSGEDGVYSQSSNIIKLLVGGALLLVGGVSLLVYRKKTMGV